MQMTDLKAIYEDNQTELNAVIQEVLSSGWYVLGKQVQNFENEFAEWLDLSHVVSVANGTDAIELSLRCLDIKPGDRVATVAHTAVATVSAIERAGAVPVLIDIEPDTMTLSPEALEKVLRNSKEPIKAVIPVHIYGHMADMPAIMQLSKQYSFHVIEDCAQAHGATLDGKKTGSFGDLAAFSFYPTKNLGAFGDGGAIATNQKEYADKLQMIRQYGWQERNASKMMGVNSRLDELQAGILRVLLKKLDDSVKRRQSIAKQYQQIAHSNIQLPGVKKSYEHAYHLYVIRTKYRESLIEYLKSLDIHAAVHYPTPVHLQPAYRDRCIVPLNMPVTEQSAKEILSLPLHPYLQDAQINRLLSCLKTWKPI
jgi:dTDP-4-amino-4,6-dideoxygalactose transaminase